MKRVFSTIIFGFFLTGCIEPSSKPISNQGASLVVLNAYGLDYLIEDDINEIDKHPEITTSLTLLAYSSKLQSLYQTANPNKKISVVIDRFNTFIKILDCSDGCVLKDHQSYIDHPNNQLLNCKPTFNANDDVSTSMYSKNALSIKRATICGIKFPEE